MIWVEREWYRRAVGGMGVAVVYILGGVGYVSGWTRNNVVEMDGKQMKMEK